MTAVLSINCKTSTAAAGTYRPVHGSPPYVHSSSTSGPAAAAAEEEEEEDAPGGVPPAALPSVVSFMT
jgi:hypothetical protein